MTEMLKAWRDGDPPEAPLLTLDGKNPLLETSLRKRLVAASKAASIPTIHSLGWLRNQAATATVERGEGIDVASRALGHTDISTTRKHYDKARMTAARKLFAASQESAFFGPANGPHQSPTGPKTPQNGQIRPGPQKQESPLTAGF